MSVLDSRKKAGWAIDARVIKAIQVLAERTGKSANQYIEKLLFDHAQLSGAIAPIENQLKDGRSVKPSKLIGASSINPDPSVEPSTANSEVPD